MGMSYAQLHECSPAEERVLGEGSGQSKNPHAETAWGIHGNEPKQDLEGPIEPNV